MLEMDQGGMDRFFGALSAAREHFHTFGSIEDSNAKLDELVKLAAICLSVANGVIRAPRARADAKEAFEAIKGRAEFNLDSGGSIFEQNSHLRIAEESEDLFQLFLTAANEVVKSSLDSGSLGSDLFNEAFGHFVRENFRSNTEDAQYMTPPEVTSFMVELSANYLDELPSRAGLVVADPSCGVGSFLTEFEKNRLLRDDPEPTLVGQDKVRRMLRIAHMSAKCGRANNIHLGLGNSLADTAWISKFDGSVDLILTNPPFGARFEREWLSDNAKKVLPFFSSTRNVRSQIDSEFLFLERYISLLKEGGILLAVVPDGVIGGSGTAALARQYLSQKSEVLSIVHLPPVTFAQAGTRTKTAVLILRKGRSRQSKFFGADVESLGFDVVRRKGAAFKRPIGTNQLDMVLQTAKSLETLEAGVVSRSPMMVVSQADLSVVKDWDVKQFALEEAQAGDEYDCLPLAEVVDFVGAERRSKRYSDGCRYLSILHVVSEGVWDYPSIFQYEPITPGTPANPGEVLLSKINPRIPRVAIVPDLDGDTIVSTEFEVLRPKHGYSPEEVCWMLRDPFVQRQLEGLASGTSASHNRIKPEKLRQVILRVSRDASIRAKTASLYRDALGEIDRGLRSILALRDSAAA